MRGLHQFCSTNKFIFNIVFNQGRFQVAGHPCCSNQDHDFFEFHSTFVLFNNILNHPRCLFGRAVKFHQFRLHASPASGLKPLFIIQWRLSQQPVGQIKDRLGAAIIRDQWQNCSTFHSCGKAMHIFKVGAPEGVNRLRIVAYTI